MQSGKSNFIYAFIKHLEEVTDIRNVGRKLDIMFCSNGFSSFNGIKQASKEQTLINELKFIQNMPRIETLVEKKNIEQLIILEDFISNLRNLNKEKQNDLISFVNKSRHEQISIICVFHEFPYGKSNFGFEKYFFNQSTHFVIFEFKINLSQVSLFAKRFLGSDLTKLFFQAFSVSRKICTLDNEMNNSHKRPYLLLNADHRCLIEDPMMKIQTDIFKRHITFSSGIFTQ